MGIPLVRTKLAIYALSGFFSAAAGVVFTIYTLSGSATAAMGLELDAIAAVVIGGTLLSGGFGFVAGSLIGALIQGVIQTLISFQGTLDVSWTKIFVAGCSSSSSSCSGSSRRDEEGRGGRHRARPRLAWAGTRAAIPPSARPPGRASPEPLWRESEEGQSNRGPPESKLSLKHCFAD